MKWVWCLALMLVSCAQATSQRFAIVEVLDAQGNQRTAVDFGRVQTQVATVVPLRIRSSGNAALVVSGATSSDSHFVVTTSLPVTVEPGAETQLEVRFMATATDQKVTATLTLSTNAAGDEKVELALSGLGLTSVLSVRPTPIAFGDVHVGESKTLSVQATNLGASPLGVTSAGLLTAVNEVSLDGGPWVKTYVAAESATLTATFTPSQMVETAQTLVVRFDGGVPPLEVPMTGRGIQALPRACFRFAGVEQCAGPDASVLVVDVDAGASGSLQFRNEGNTAVRYSVTYQEAQCDGGVSTRTEATVSLPMSGSDPKPWLSAPVSLGRPCSGETTVIWSRADARAPNMLEVTLRAQ